MFSFDYDLTGALKLLVMILTLFLVLSMREAMGIFMWAVAAFYCHQAHRYYLLAKSYKRLGGHMKKAIEQ